MTDSYPWFKFDAEAYLSGKIMHQTLEAQGVFNQIAALCWKIKGPIDRSELHYRNPRDIPSIDACINSLHSCRLIVVTGDMISIKYMDELLKDANDNRDKKSLAGKASAESRRNKPKTNPTHVEQVSTDVQQNPTDKNKNRIEREEEKNKEYNHTSVHPSEELSFTHNPEAKKPSTPTGDIDPQWWLQGKLKIFRPRGEEKADALAEWASLLHLVGYEAATKAHQTLLEDHSVKYIYPSMILDLIAKDKPTIDPEEARIAKIIAERKAALGYT
jgi:hypothetical protein